MGLAAEIYEQPDVLQAFLENSREKVGEIARAIALEGIDYVFLAARGTSDNAGLYAKYLWGARNGLPIALAAPSLFSVYESPPELRRALVLGISQSGQSPDIVSVISEGRRQGVPTLAITNDPHSPLAEAAQFVLDTNAGLEHAVAATKTYTAQLLSIALLSAAMSGDEESQKELETIPALIRLVLDSDSGIKETAEKYRSMQQCVVLGRGYNYATIYEWSLKLKELAYVVAAPYSSADFRHGPMAILDAGFPVLAVAPDGKVFDDVMELIHQVRDELTIDLLVISNEAEALSVAQSPIRIPPVPEWLSPIISIVPAQLFCYHLANAKGYSPEEPRRLTKVTRTR